MIRSSIALLAFGIGTSLANAQEGREPGTPIIKAPQAQTVRSAATLRMQVVQEAAMSESMRASLTKQSEVINKLLEENGRLLDDVYDFGSLMIGNSVMPPVIRKVEKITEQSGDMLRYSAAQFQIVKQAAFATRAPTWRTYLPIPIFSENVLTHPSLKPANDAERESARQGVDRGWKSGIDQANGMFLKGLTRLQNDYLGMMTYHALLRSNMVTAPVINRKDTAVSGNAESLTIDQSTYKIEAKPVFNPNLSSWLAIIDASSGAALETAAKITSAESARASVATRSRNDLMRAWTDRDQ